MATSLKQFLNIGRPLWTRVGVTAITLIKKRTDKGIDRNDRPFPNYTAQYAQRKQDGFRRKDGRRNKRYEGLSLERQIQPPNFRLTGRTMFDLKPISSTKNGVTVGWQDAEAASIILANEQRGKYKVGGASDKDLEAITSLIDKELVERWNDARAVNINVRY